jgi:hypothetical protein
MISRVGSSERVDVNFGFGQCLTHAGERARTICKKDRELRCRFDGEFGMRVHLVFKVMPGIASDNLSKFWTYDSVLIFSQELTAARRRRHRRESIL